MIYNLNKLKRILGFFLLIITLNLFYFSPASASTYQDVTNFLAANPAPSGCVNWVEGVGSGYTVWRRCGGENIVSFMWYEYFNGTPYPPNLWTGGWVVNCTGEGDSSLYYSANSSGIYRDFSGYAYSQYCDGSYGPKSYNPPSLNPANASTCKLKGFTQHNCLSLNNLLATFFIDQCLNKLTNTYESCAQNCKDPVDKAGQTIAEICSDGIDNNCDGKIDEGCGIQLPETVYQCEDKFKTTPPYYDTTTKSICSKGCLLSSLTMVLDYYLSKKGLPMVDAESLNEWLKDNNGFKPDGRINWDAIKQYPGADVFYDWKGSETASKETLDKELADGHPVILNVKDGNHFIIAIGKESDTYKIIDPGYTPQATTLKDRYNNKFNGIRIIRPR